MPREIKATGDRRQATGKGVGATAKRDDESQRASRHPSSHIRRRPSVAVVGAGRLGTALALALSNKGYRVAALVSRRVARARRAAELTRSDAHALDFKQLDELPATDLLFITTPDDAIEATAHALASSSAALSSSNSRARRVVLHASGALSSEVLAPLGARGLAVGSLHPLASITDDAAAGARALGGAFFCVEGEDLATRAARRVVRAIGGRGFTVGARDKALYHAAAVMTSGHTVALFDTATRLLARCGLDERRAREVLLPLLASTLANLSAQSPARSLTGTFARADVATVKKHLAALAAAKDDEGAAVYKLLGRRSLALAREAGADARALAEIARLLEES